MNEYLTNKGSRRSWWELPTAIFSAVLTAIGVYACCGLPIEPGEVFVTLLAYLLILAFLSTPLWLVLPRLARRRLAQRLATRLAAQPGESVPLSKLDARMGVRDAEKKVRRLIGLGYLSNLDIDQRNQCLWIAASREEPQTPTDDVLSRIRALNDATADETISQQISRIEIATDGIFRVLKQKPERSNDVRRLMNYYLPTTIKLLETYDMMEDQPFQGENIRASRRRIEEVLAKIAEGIERQQDNLFRSDALDVEAEIAVMEAMLRSDAGVVSATSRG